MGLFDIFKKSEEKEPFNISSPVDGKVIDIKDTNDDLFKTETLGKGVGIIANDNTLVAPISGTISSFFETKHAIAIKSNNGIEVLIHVGIDTVELNGKYFTALKKEGDKIKRGEPLLNVEFDKISEEGYDNTVLMVITNTTDYTEIKTLLGDKHQGDIVIEIEE